MSESKYAKYNNLILDLIEDGLRPVDIARRVIQVYGLDESILDNLRRHVSRLSHALKQSTAESLGFAAAPPSQSDFQYYESERQASVSYVTNKPIKTLEDALEASNVDLNIWKPVRWRYNAWKQTPDGDDLIQVKVDFKKRDEDDIDPLIIADQLKDMLKEVNSTAPTLKLGNINGDKMLEICIYDLHFGSLAWDKEAGEDYNWELAKQRLLNAVDDLINRSFNYDISTILFTVGNDYFHTDKAHPFPATTRGTPQQDDSRWQKLFTEGVRTLIEAIDKLKQIAPVHVVVIPGNHDFERAFYAGTVLEVNYSNDTLVTVDNAPVTRKYYQFGKCLIGMTHGNEEKLANLPLIMAREVPPEMWASTQYREWHLGHLHHKRMKGKKTYTEMHGIVVRDIMTAQGEDESTINVRHIGSMAATDAWHAKKGYIGANKSAEAFIWDKEKGLETILIHNVD